MRHSNAFRTIPGDDVVRVVRKRLLNGAIDALLTDDEKSLLNEMSGGAVPKAASGWPSAVAFRVGNWSPDWRDYTISQNDTMSGISATYLLDPSRWLEIWQLQEFPQGTANRLNRFYNKADPSSKNPGRGFRQGDILRMPAEAGARAKQYYEEGRESAPSAPSAPGSQPGYEPPPKSSGVTGSKLAIPLLVAAAVAGGAYLLST